MNVGIYTFCEILRDAADEAYGGICYYYSVEMFKDLVLPVFHVSDDHQSSASFNMERDINFWLIPQDFSQTVDNDALNEFID